MLSVVIAVSGQGDRKIDNFVEVAGAVQKQQYRDYEVIVVEQVIDEPVYPELVKCVLPKAKYIQVKHPVFNLRWLRNIGAKESSGDLIFFSAAETVFGSDYFGAIVGQFTDPYMLAWDRIVMLNEIGRAIYSLTRQYRLEWPEPTVEKLKVPGFEDGSGGYPVFDRSFFFEELGGFNEAFVNWGGGDNEMMIRTLDKTQGTRSNMNYCLLHLPHYGRLPNERRWEMLEAVRTMPSELSAAFCRMDLGNILKPNAQAALRAMNLC